MNWISVEDKQPEEGQDCWICQNDNTISRGDFVNFHEIFGSGFGSYDEFIKIEYVKCWMPYFTPEPPKNKEEK